MTSNFFPFQRHSDFHEYRIHQSPRTFSEFYVPFCLSSLRKYENSLDSVTRANSSHAPRRGAFHPDDGGKMDRVCCRRAKREWKKEKKRHSNLSCTRMRGGEGVENSSVEPLTRDRCMHIWYVRERNPFCPSKSTPFCTFIAPRSHSNNCAPGCLLTPIRDNPIETYTARKDYRRIVCSIAIPCVEY